MRNRTVHRLLAVCVWFPVAAADDVTVGSPDGRVQFRLSLDSKGRTEYSVSFREKPVIETSPLGISVGGVQLAEGVQLGKAEPGVWPLTR